LANTPSITVIDGLSGTEVVRELNQAELSDLEAVKTQAKARQDELEAKEKARQSALAKLAALGLTEAEIAAL
jgi:acyl-CoA reductase-like NAD-dependent aldehyde dehydrogenase